MRDLGAVLVGLLFIGFAACSGPKSDDDDDDDDGGESGNGSGGTKSSGGSGGSGVTGGTGAVGPGASDCQTLCNRADACDKPPDTGFTLSTCISGCTEADAQSICASQYDQYIGCYLGLSDFCVIYDTSSTACESEVTAYAQCVVDYCIGTPSDPACN